MSVVDEIEAELKQITAPPYVLFHDRGVWSVLPAGRLGEICRGFKHEPDAQFYRASPERLAALCAYVRAAETWIKCPALPISDETASEFLDKRQRLKDKLQSARRELGLGKE